MGMAGPERTFRVGCTSFVLPTFALPNVEWLAGKVEDIQLLLVEPDGDLPSAEDFRRMADLSALYGHTYTVHLPDVMAVEGPAHARSVDDLVKLVELARPAAPEGYVVHVNPGPPADGAARAAWMQLAVDAIGALSTRTGLPRTAFQVENQGSADVPAHRAIVDRAGCSMCVDVGHVLRDGGDPVAALRDNLAVARHVHLHGVADRDHRSVRHFPPLGELLSLLGAARWKGAITLEVFGQAPFEDSLRHVLQAWAATSPVSP